MENHRKDCKENQGAQQLGSVKMVMRAKETEQRSSIVYRIEREEDRLRTKSAKSSACLSPNGLRGNVSARLSPHG